MVYGIGLWYVIVAFPGHKSLAFSCENSYLLSYPLRVTVTSYFVYKVISNLESSDLPIRVGKNGVYKLIFYLTIVNKT